jgi:hypothetical protein
MKGNRSRFSWGAALALMPFLSGVASAAPREWTILFYINGDNNLVANAGDDFEKIARIGSSDRVALVVQMDRKRHVTLNPEPPPNAPSHLGWVNTRRFFVQRGMCVESAEALSPELGELNMAARETLEEFVSWGLTTYPAPHVALVIWDHGQGWRDVPLAQRDLRDAPFRSALSSPFSAVTSDDDPGKDMSGAGALDKSTGGLGRNQFYNSDIHAALQRALAGRKLDVLAFDSCLMGMLETAYAFKDVSRVFVASEELVPAYGFQYDDWLDTFQTAPPADGEALGLLLVTSYRKRYEKPDDLSAAAKGKLACKGIPPPLRTDPRTTLSAVNLERVQPLADAVGELAKELLNGLATNRAATEAAIREARGTSHFAPDRGYYHVDLGRFLENLAAGKASPAIRARAVTASAALRVAVLDSYGGRDRLKKLGASGLAIYFPASGAEYDTDPYRGTGYDKPSGDPRSDGTRAHPVAFVDDEPWANFLHAYLKTVKQSPPESDVTAASPSPGKSSGGSAKRVALVVGIGDYGGVARLESPVDDALAMKMALDSLGFEVTPVLDATVQDLRSKVSVFEKDLKGKKLTSGDVVFFFFAGHGLQFQGENYLMGKDAHPEKPTDLPGQAVSLGEVLKALAVESDNSTAPPGTESPLRFVVLDACRTNPWSPSNEWLPGLAQPAEKKTNTLISFATAPDRTADDATVYDELDGRSHSPYTKSLHRYIRVPGLSVDEVFRSTRTAVIVDSSGRQTPWEATSLQPSFSFREAAYAQATLVEGDDEVFLLHEGRDVLTLSTSRGQNRVIPLKPGSNELTVRVYNQHTCVGGRWCARDPSWWQFWVGAPEGWRYTLRLVAPDGTPLLEDINHTAKESYTEEREAGPDRKHPEHAIPILDGPHHGKTFDAARIELDVDELTGIVSLKRFEPNLWKATPKP